MTREIAHQKSFKKALYSMEPNFFSPGKLPGVAPWRRAGVLKYGRAMGCMDDVDANFLLGGG
jgi:Mn-containing catalase